MPLRIQTDVKEIEGILNEILNTKCPPVGRCRLLSSGFGLAHALNIGEDISGHKECLGCGNCIDICPFLFREPSRREKTEQRTSMALESIVDGEYFSAVFATTGQGRATCFLVDKGTPGFRVSGGGERGGWRTQVRKPMLLSFDRCRVPVENILGEEGRAFHLGKRWLPSRRVIRGAKCIGITQRLLEESRTQVQSFQSFGQSISRRTSIEAALADIGVGIHACRLMVYEAACKVDSGEAIKREAAMVKLFALIWYIMLLIRWLIFSGGHPTLPGYLWKDYAVAS